MKRHVMKSEQKRIRNCLIIVGVLIGVICYTALCVLLCSYVPIDSDKANHLLQAHDILQGNFFLSGWILTGVTFITTDLPFYCLSDAFGNGIGPEAIRLAGGMMIAAQFFSGLIAVAYGAKGIDGLKRLCLYVFLMAVPSVSLLVYSRVHAGSVCLALIALTFFGMLIDDVRERKLSRFQKNGVLIIAAASLALGSIGDILTAVSAGLPILLVLLSLVGQAVDKDEKRQFLLLMTFTVAAIVTGLFLDFAYIKIGGADKNSYIGQRLFVASDALGERFSSYISSVLSLFDAHFFGTRMSGIRSASRIAALVIAVLVFSILIIKISDLFHGVAHYDAVSCLLAFSIVSVSLAYVFSGMSETRYITIIPVAGAAMLARNYQRLWRALANPRPFQILLIFLVVFAFAGRAYTFTSQDRFEAESAVNVVSISPNDQSFLALANRLESLGLENGYAQFWNASSVTVMSKNKISIRHVAFAQEGLRQSNWFCKESWYEAEAHFVVVNSTEVVIGDYKVKPDSEGLIVAALGEPDGVYECNEYRIYQYDEDISTYLMR